MNKKTALQAARRIIGDTRSDIRITLASYLEGLTFEPVNFPCALYMVKNGSTAIELSNNETAGNYGALLNQAVGICKYHTAMGDEVEFVNRSIEKVTDEWCIQCTPSHGHDVISLYIIRK